MATKTLGVKFQIAGVSEAQAGLNNLRNSLNQSLQRNKQAVKENLSIAQSDKKRAEVIEKTNQKIFFSYLGLRAKIRNETNSMLAETEAAIKRQQRSFSISVKDYFASNFGSKTQKQNLVIKQEKQDFKQRSTYKKISVHNRALVLEFRLAYKEFFTKLETLLEELKPEKTGILDHIGSLFSQPLGFAFDAILFPFQSAVAGMFERLGEVQVEDFGRGFSDKLQKSLGLPFDEVGGDVGEIFGQGLKRTYEAILKRSKEAIISDLDDKSPQIKGFYDDVKKIFTGALIQALAVPVKAHKRMQLRNKAVPKAKNAIGDQINNRNLSDSEVAEIQKQKSITILTGGVNMDSAAGNTDFSERLFRNYVDDTYVTSVKNTWSNQAVGKEYSQVLNSIIRKIIDNPVAKDLIETQLNEKGLIDDINKQNKKLGKEQIDTSDLVESIFKLIQTEDLPLVKLLETAYEGYNIDDINIAAEAAFFKEKFPDKPVNLVGTSAGGFNVAGALEILNLLGYTDIKAAGITTPATGIEFTGNSEDYFSSIGTQDEMYKGLNEGIFDSTLPIPDFMQVVPKAGRGHLLPTYMGNKEFRDRFAQFFQGRMTLKDLGAPQMGFLSRISQDPQYGDIVRTFQGAFGENVEEGYQFNADDLQGFKDYDLKKKISKAKKGGSPEIIKIAEEYEDFIDSLIDELRRGVKPLESLQKAVKFYPELKGIADEYKDIKLDDNSETRQDNQKITERYNQQLNQIIERSGESASQAINNDEITIDPDTAYSAIRDRMAEYRNAVKQGLFEKARQTGELILEATEYLKQIFNESDDSRRGQLTRIQNEILSGDRGAGRSSTPLSELFSQTDNVQLELDLWQDTADGARESLNQESGQQVGSDFAQGIIDGAEDELDINSPSKVFAWIGEMVKAGFVGGIDGLSEFLSESMDGAVDSVAASTEEIADSISDIAADLNGQSPIDALFETEGSSSEINEFFGGLVQSASDALNDIVAKFPILGKVKNFLFEIGGDVLQAIGLFSLGDVLLNFGSDALAVARDMESLERSIESVSQGAIDGAKNISFARREASRLSIDLISAQESYKRILGATRDTPLEGFQTRNIFSSLSTTARNRGLNTDSTNRLFIGFEQAIAKGQFMAEEVQGQLSEVLGDIRNLLSRSVGISGNMLGEVMQAGDLKTVEVMPRLLAQLNAQNAALGSTSQTAQAAQTRLNNSILEFKDSVGRKLQPVQKLGLNFLADILDDLQDKTNLLIKLTVSLTATVLSNLILKVLATKLAVHGLRIGLFKLIGLMISAPFLKFAGKFLLISAAMEVWTNNLNLAKNSFPKLEDRIEASTNRLDALKKAFDDAGNAANNYGKKQPEQLQLNEGSKVGNNKFLQAVAGGDRWNLDNFFRNRFNSFGENYGKYQNWVANKTGQIVQQPKVKITTQAQKKQYDFVVGTSDLIGNADQTLSRGNQAKSVLSEIQELDEQARELQSRRLDILPGDNQALQKALEAEKELLKQRDQLLEKTAQYQESLQGDIQDIKDTLLELNELDKTGGNAEEKAQRANSREALEGRLEDLEDEKKAIDQINSAIPKFLSASSRLLRNSQERVSGFIGNQEDDAVVNRTEAIKDAIAQGMSEADLELKLDNLSATDLKDRVNFINQEIKRLENRLSSAYLQEGVAGLERAAKTQADLDGVGYLGLTPEILERMADEGRSSQETKAANYLLQLDELEGVLAQSESGLVDLVKSNRNRLKDYNRTISDYFFRITQQIKEAQLETDRLLSQIFYTDIKNKLSSAIAPGSNTFVNGIIDNIQSVIDQAQQVAEKVFGDSAAQLGFESETRSLATEMQDFIRQIGNAGDAVADFTRQLTGFAGKKSEVRSQKSENKVFPIAGLTADTAKITSGYGWRNIFGRKDFHEGIDIAVKGGTPVRATNSGIVRKILPLADQTQVGIETAKGVMEWFIHLGQNLKVTKGDRVSAGQTIGYVAHTTNRARKARVSTGDHLDYRVNVNGKWVEPKAFLKASQPNNVQPNNVQLVSSNQTSNQPKVNRSLDDKALDINRKLHKSKLKNLKIAQRTTEQEREALEIQVKQTIEANKRQIDQAQKENQSNLLNTEGKFADLGGQYNYQSVQTEIDSSLRNIRQQFLDADLDLISQIRNTKDAITTIKNLILKAPEEIARLKAIGTPEALASAKTAQAGLDGLKTTLLGDKETNEKIAILTQEIARLKAIGTPKAIASAKVIQSERNQLENSLTGLEANLKTLESTQEKLPELQKKSQDFLKQQNALKQEQEKLTKQNNLLGIKANITNQRGTLEQQSQVKLQQEELRLQIRLNEVRQQTKPGKQRDDLIDNELNLSQINKENINYDSQLAELDLERRLLDLDGNIDHKNSGFLARYGFNLQGDKLKRESAIATENNRFQKELIQLQKDFAGNPELLAEFTEKARELNRVNLSSIENEFKSLGKTLEGYLINSTQGFFDKFTLNFFDGKAQSDRAQLEERLRYAEEVNQLENQYRGEENEGKLAHLKNRARELNEQKLDQINGQFNIFTRGVNLAKEALLEFVKQMAQMVARQAAARFLSSILGSAIGGGGGASSNFSSGGQTAGFLGGVGSFFNASEGITVPGDNIKSRIVPASLTKFLALNNNGIARAFRAEGEGAQLGVFHTGEELLSRKTGEAGVYQGLKAKFGINPLQNLVENFNNGGTVGAIDIEQNILSGFSSSRPRIDLSDIEGRGQNAQEVIKTINLTQQIITPNVDSFNLSQEQRNQDLVESMKRGF